MQKLQHKNKLLKTISVKTYTLIKKIIFFIKKVVFLLFVFEKKIYLYYNSIKQLKLNMLKLYTYS